MHFDYNFINADNCGSFTIQIINNEFVIAAWGDANYFSIHFNLKNLVHKLLSDVSGFYPRFTDWVDGKLIPGLISGEREIIILSSGREVKGYSVIKKTSSEDKICTLYVCPESRRRGLGDILIRLSIERLGNSHPLITVGDERRPYFEGLFKRYGFVETQEVIGLYGENRVEHVYNCKLVK